MLFTNLTRANEIGANSYLLELHGRRLVLDCGMHPRVEGSEALPLFERIEGTAPETALVTHSHLDHVGALPVLMRLRPDLTAFATLGTARIADAMLHNSVNVMSRKREELGLAAYPLFTHREAGQTCGRLQPRRLGQPFLLTGEPANGDAGGEPTFEFVNAGHIPGAAAVLLRAENRTILYTGDVNLLPQSLCGAARLPDPPLDVLIVETTRGDHGTPAQFSREAERLRLAKAIRDGFDRGGSVLIPVFALGKTQELLVMLHELRNEGQLDDAPIYIGGLSTKVTALIDRLGVSIPRLHPGLDILGDVGPRNLNGQEAATLPLRPRRIYALSSGMMTERTLSNIFARRLLTDPRQSIFFVGYSDPQSPAGRLRATPRGSAVALDDASPPIPVECAVDHFDFTGHATRESLRTYIERVRPAKVILVHGDPPALRWFQDALAYDLPDTQVIVPPPGETIEV